MKFRATLLLIGFVMVIIGTATGKATAADVPQIIISQFKITSSGGQFVTLYNTTNMALDLAQYEVDYINSSGRLTNVPVSGQLPAHGYYMLNDDQLRMCYQMIVSAVSLGFATTNGSLQIWKVSPDKTVKSLQDGVTWASKAAAGAVTLPTQNSTSTVSLLRQPTDSLGNPQVATPSTGTWQAVVPDVSNPCTLNIVNTATPAASPSSNPGNQLGVGQAPPVTVVSIVEDDTETETGPMLPPADIGLDAPQIAELLPNPDGTGTDATDEFIELYNPNNAPFHLVGFTLQTGTTSKHSYKFVDGTILAPLSFTAFYSADTGLSLSNASGRAALLDPFGNALSETESYVTAKDGQTWALANGEWYWTVKATPNAANVIKQAVTSTAKRSSASAKAKGAATTSGAGAVATKTKPAGTTSSAVAATETAAQPVPTHRYVLVVIGVLAVGYGIYEYRHDLGNRFHQFRTNRAARRNNRPALARR